MKAHHCGELISSSDITQFCGVKIASRAAAKYSYLVFQIIFIYLRLRHYALTKLLL